MSAKSLFLGLMSIAFLSSCASSYKSIEPVTFNFSNTEIGDNVVLKYRYNILRERGNKKFAKDEDKHGVRIVAVEITNNNDFPISLGKNLKLTSGESEVPLLSPLSARSKIKQCTACYLPYALLTFMTLTTSNGNGNTTTSIPIGYVVGPVVTGLNMVKANTANKKLKDVLLDYDLLNREIRQGETITGLISIERSEFVNLKPMVTNN